MPVSRRPANRAERAVCVGVIAPRIADPSGLPPAVAAVLAATLAPATAAYVAALAAADEAAVRVGHASDAVAAASEALDVAVRRWTRTVVDAAGKSRVRELVPLLGGTPSGVMRRKAIDKADRLGRLVPRVAETAIAGDPARLAELAHAAAALEAACVALGAAEGARYGVTQTLRQAEPAFDRAWVAFDRIFAAIDPGGDLEVRFVRARRAGRGEMAPNRPRG